MDLQSESKFLQINFLLGTIILIEGFVSIAIEIITIRQLLPFVGGSVIVTSMIIGIFLLFLALGYRQGGMVKQQLKIKLRNNFLLASIWAGVGLSYLFVLYFFYALHTTIAINSFYSLISYLLIIIAPLIYILGQTVPITMNMIKLNMPAGQLGGDRLSLSTIGSFLGATITALVFLQYLGVAWTIFIVVLLLLFLVCLLMTSKQSFIMYLPIMIAMSWIIYYLNINTEQTTFLLTDNYANYQILNSQNYQLQTDEKILSINNSLSSYTNLQKQGFPYIETIKKVLFSDLKLRNTDILVLGAGGFSLSAENTFNNHFTYVDIDDQIKQVTLASFLQKINGKFIVDDARHFLHVSTKKYQAIIVDVFTNIKTIPPHLLTYEFMQEVSRNLFDHGTVIFNIIAKPTLSDSYSKRVDNTIRSIFKNCMIEPSIYADAVTNILYICNKSSNQTEHTIYSDNRSTASSDSYSF